MSLSNQPDHILIHKANNPPVGTHFPIGTIDEWVAAIDTELQYRYEEIREELEEFEALEALL